MNHIHIKTYNKQFIINAFHCSDDYNIENDKNYKEKLINYYKNKNNIPLYLKLKHSVFPLSLFENKH